MGAFGLPDWVSAVEHGLPDSAGGVSVCEIKQGCGECEQCARMCVCVCCSESLSLGDRDY